MSIMSGDSPESAIDLESQGGLTNDADIIRMMERRINENLVIEQTWRQEEVRDSLAVYEGDQWLDEDMKRQLANGMPIVTINRVKPVIQSIVGFEIQNRLDVKYVPRLTTDKQEGFADVVGNAVKYIEQKSNADLEYTLAFQDMLICGVGATDTLMDYTKPPHDGEFRVERVFPAFLFWDPASRRKNKLDSDYVIRLKVVNRNIIRQEFGLDYFDDIYSSTLDARILEFFQDILAVKQLGVIYEYQWREKVPFKQVENPFKDLNPEELALQQGIDTMEGVEEFVTVYEATKQMYAEKYDFDANMDQTFPIQEAGDWTEFKKACDFLGIKPKFAKQFKYKYYRAIITGHKVMEKSENYSQSGFSIKFMTGDFSELVQHDYGLLRSCKEPQRLLNQVVSDYQGFLNTIPKGGVSIERDAVANLQGFLDTYSKAKMVTIYEPGALSGGKMQPKIAPPLPQGILEMIQYADAQIMSVCGVTPELMGMMVSKEQNSAFMRQQIRQGLTTLSTYFDARRAYLQEQARLYIDCVRVLAENNEGRLVHDVLGEYGGQYLPLLRDSIAPDYDIIIDETPTSPDQKEETFLKLLDMQSVMLNKPNPIDLMPLIMEYAPFQQDVVRQIKELMQPPPPPEPDPINIRLLTTEADYKQASAYKLTMEAMEKEQNLRYGPAKYVADINLTETKAAAELAKIEQMTNERIDKRMSAIFNQQL
jgi:hypothetical protein